MVPQKCQRCRSAAFWVQLGGTLLLTALKLLVGIVGNSKAMMAGALYSATNVLSSFAILGSNKLTDKPADQEHPYGYGKTDFLLSAISSAVIVAGAVSLGITAFQHIIHLHIMHHPDLYVIVAAVISVLANEALYRYLHCVGTQFNSATMFSNALSVRSDSLTSIAVIVSVIGVRIGFTHCDGIVTLLVAALILWTNGKNLLTSIQGLMDRAVPSDLMTKIESSAKKVEGVRISRIRARFVGPRIWTNVDVEMKEDSTVEEFNEVAAKLREALRRSDDLVEKVLVKYRLC